jgi:hypothetical protein
MIQVAGLYFDCYSRHHRCSAAKAGLIFEMIGGLGDEIDLVECKWTEGRSGAGLS